MDPQGAKTTSRVDSALLAETHEELNPKWVLVELFELLEAYGPLWYTEELRHRTLTALSSL